MSKPRKLSNFGLKISSFLALIVLRATWVSTSCINVNVNKSVTGILQSHHGYDGVTTYLPNTNVCWKLYSKLGDKYRIQLKRQSFALEQTSDCTYDYVSISCDDDDKSSEIGKYCGSGGAGHLPPRDIYSSKNKLYVHFVTDATNQLEGFLFTFKIVGANGHKPSCDVTAWSLGMIIGVSFLGVLLIVITCTVVICCVRHKTRVKIDAQASRNARAPCHVMAAATTCRAPGHMAQAHTRNTTIGAVSYPNASRGGGGRDAHAQFPMLTLSRDMYPLPSNGVPVAPPPYSPSTHQNKPPVTSAINISSNQSNTLETMDVESCNSLDVAKEDTVNDTNSARPHQQQVMTSPANQAHNRAPAVPDVPPPSYASTVAPGHQDCPVSPPPDYMA